MLVARVVEIWGKEWGMVVTGLSIWHGMVSEKGQQENTRWRVVDQGLDGVDRGIMPTLLHVSIPWPGRRTVTTFGWC